MRKITVMILACLLCSSPAFSASWKTTDTEDSSVNGGEIVLLENEGGTDNNWMSLTTIKTWVLNALSAGSVAIVDTGTYYTGTTVEAALQEAGADIAAFPTLVLSTGLTVQEDTPSAGTDTVSVTYPVTAEAFSGSGWNGDTGGLSRNDAYDQLHLFDTDDDGKIDVLDTTAGIIKTDANGVPSVATSGTDYQPAIDTENVETSGTLQGKMVVNSYTAAQTLTFADHNASVVQMTTADEVTLWDCETAGVGAFVMLWARDAEKIEVVPASGDHFNLFAGTALTADYELDMAATAGTKITLMCTADDTWSVYSETAASADGGAAD